LLFYEIALAGEGALIHSSVDSCCWREQQSLCSNCQLAQSWYVYRSWEWELPRGVIYQTATWC